MKVLYRLFALLLAATYLCSPVALIFAAAPKPTCQIVVKPTSINVGGSVTVSWTSTNATAGAITNIGNVGAKGSINLLPSSSGATYFGAFTGAGGTANCSAKVVVTTGSGSGSGGTQTTDTTSNSVNVGSATQYTAPASTQTTAPSIVGSGLVPCGYLGFYGDNTSHANSTGCQACDLATLIQNLITFLIGLSIPIAAALFAWAGVLFFTAADDSSKITQAKKIFKNAFIGFVIAITAWIVINTVLSVIFGNGPFSGGKWFTIECSPVSGRQVNATLNQVLGTLNGSTVSTSGTPSAVGTQNSDGTYSNNVTCSVGSNYDPSSQTCYNPTTDIISEPTSAAVASTNSALDALTASCDAGSQASCDAANVAADGNLTQAQKNQVQDALQDACDGDTSQTTSGSAGTNGSQSSCDALSRMIAVDSVSGSNTDCSPTNIQNAAAAGGYTLSDQQAATLSCIAVPESACGRNTSIATTPSGQVTSATGMFQIVFGSGNDQCHNLNMDVCTQAANAAGFTVSGNLNCYASVHNGQRLGSDACRAAASNISCNASAAACLVQARGGKFTDWTADSRSSAQSRCISQFAN